MRRYTDKEVGQILGKAAALQSGSAEFSTPEGTTLAELKRVSDEVGIDPQMIERAAAELDTLRQTSASGKSNIVLLEQIVAGEVSDETWEDLVTILRTTTGGPGKSECGPRTREWVGKGNNQSIVLTGTSRRGRTQLRLLGNNSAATETAGVFGFLIGMFLTLAPIVANVKTGVFGPLLTSLLVLLVAASVAFATFAAIYSRRRNFRSELNSVMDRVVDVIESEQASLGETAPSALSLIQPVEPADSVSVSRSI